MTSFFTNNPLWHEQIGKIYAFLERVKISEEQSKDLLRLQRTNRILSIGSTTAIEGNRLTTQQVFDVINGKTVFAPLHDIKEVKNAFAAYEQMPDLDPYSVSDFLKAHSFITENLVQESGQFRTVGVAVVNSKREIIHSGADFCKAPALVTELLEWGKLLILIRLSKVRRCTLCSNTFTHSVMAMAESGGFGKRSCWRNGTKFLRGCQWKQ
jgi:Fic family protein